MEGNWDMHLNSEAALDLIEGRLTNEQETVWRQHTETCSVCAEAVRNWKEVKEDLKRSHLLSAPDQDLKAVLWIFQPARRSVIASILFDSFLQPAMAGARGAASASRQLVMRAEEFDIHVKIWGDQERKQMLGQVLSRNGKDFIRSGRFHLVRNGERIES